MKRLRFPKAHPKIYLGNECPPLEQVDGIVRLRILPPRNIEHAVLGISLNGKFVFTLCYTCAKTENPGLCNHSDEERALEDVFVSYEIQAALRYKYKILEIYECLHYEETMKLSDGEGMFTGFVNQFLKGKTEASGWPKHVKTEEEKMKFIADYLEHEGIELDPEGLDNKNDAVKTFCKLLLNSLWGKLCQRDNLPKTMVINEFSELQQLMAAPNVRVKSMLDALGRKLMVTYVNPEEAIRESNLQNVIVASFVTAHGRLLLLDLLLGLGERVVYFDTGMCCTVN
jgi:hypothetical protein